MVPALGTLRHRHYRLMWVCSVISSVGTWMQNAVFGVLILQKTGSPLLTTLIPAANQILAGPLAPVGGLLADRFNRRDLLVATQAGFALTTAGLALAVAMDANVIVILLATVASGAVGAINFPAFQSLFPRLVPDEEMQAAVSLNSVTFNLARIVGPALGVLVLTVAGTATVFWVNAATFSLYSAALLLVPRAYGLIADKSGPKARLRDGLSYAAKDPTIRTMILGIGTISLFALNLIWLAPLVAERVWGDPKAAGYVLTSMGVGAVIGALGAGNISETRRPNFLVGMFLGLATTLGTVALAPVPAATVVAVALFGSFYMGAAVILNSLTQLASEDEMRGRVMSFYMSAWVGLLPIGAVIAGAVAQAVGRGPGTAAALLVGSGACVVAAVVLMGWRRWVPEGVA